MSQTRNPIPILPSFSRMLRLTHPNREDAIAFIILSGLAVLVFRAAEGAVAPLSTCISSR
jgi:NitT/TauT family transport system permease protein